MLTKEGNVYDHFSQHWPWFSARVENKVGPGTPDIYYSNEHGHGNWIEIKSIQPFACFVLIRPAQVAWHKHCWAQGGCSLLLVECDAHLFIFLGKQLSARMPLEKAYQSTMWKNIHQFISPTTANVDRWRRYRNNE